MQMTDIRSKQAHSKRVRGWIRHILLLVTVSITLYPLLWLVSSSFKPESEVFTNLGLIPSRVTIDNYQRGWSALEVSFGQFLLNSAIVATLTVVGTVLSASLAAYAFAILKPRGARVLFAVVLGSMMLPLHVIIVPQYIIFQELGWVGSYLPLVVPRFLATDALYIFIIVQFMRGIPPSIIDAAKIDSAGSWQIYRSIVMPLAAPALITSGLLSFLYAWNDFFSQLIYLSDIRTYTVPVGLRLYLDSLGNSDFGSVFAMSTISILPVLVVFILFQRHIVEGVSTTGIRE